MIKLLLSIVIITVSFLVGNTFSVRLINRRKTLSGIVAAICRMKTMICFGGADTRTVVEECLCGEAFPLISIEAFNGTEAYDKAFEKGVNSIAGSFSLAKEDKELLLQFGTLLGSTDVTGQIAHTGMYTELFGERLNVVKEQESAKSKLYRVLGFSLGCIISLLIV